jgi:hypothetical protein
MIQVNCHVKFYAYSLNKISGETYLIMASDYYNPWPPFPFGATGRRFFGKMPLLCGGGRGKSAWD